MKKTIAAVIILVLCIVSACLMTGCTNRSWGDFTYSFEEAIIRLPNGNIVEGRVDSWLDFEDGDQIQVKINGQTYLTHISNVVLISK